MAFPKYKRRRSMPSMASWFRQCPPRQFSRFLAMVFCPALKTRILELEFAPTPRCYFFFLSSSAGSSFCSFLLPLSTIILCISLTHLLADPFANKMAQRLAFLLLMSTHLLRISVFRFQFYILLQVLHPSKSIASPFFPVLPPLFLSLLHPTNRLRM